MASPAAPLPSSFSHLHTAQTSTTHHHRQNRWLQPEITRTRTSNRGGLRIFAAQTSKGPGKVPPPPPGVDTRIHWENEDEGWIGGSSNSSSGSTHEKFKPEEKQEDLLGEKFSELLNNSTGSHYQFLGVSAQADIEEIKSAYRRLSKEYHPDTTSLPLKSASEKFLRLRDIYDTLSDPEKRKFYNWTLAQEAASREAEKMRMKFEDPYMKEVQNWESVPDLVDRLGGRNIELSGQAKSALTFDIFVIILSICCIVYVILFKEPYY